MSMRALWRRIPAEYLFVLLYGVVLWSKFYAFDRGLSPRFNLTLVTFLGGLGVILCLVLPLLLLPVKVRGAALILLDFLLSFLLLADKLTLRYYMDLFSFRNLGLSTQVGEIADSIFALLRPGDVFLFLDLLLFIPLVWWFGRRDYWLCAGRCRFAAVLFFVAAGCGAAVYKLDHYNRSCRGAMYSMWDRPAVCISTGSLAYHTIDLWNTLGEALSKKGAVKGEEEEIRRWLSDWHPDGEKEGFGLAEGRNLILIQVESLQEFVMDLKVDGFEVTPNLNRLRRQGLYFSRAYNQTASGNSSDSEFMANTSLFPIARGVAFMRYAGNRYCSLGTMLAERGYRTLAFHGDRPGFWNRNHVYPSIGFQRYVSKVEFRPEESIGLGLSDKSFFRQSLEILKNEPRPFYAFLVTLTSHYPFNFAKLREEVPDFQAPSLEGSLLGDYLRSVYYTDRHLGGFIRGLEEAGLLKESLVVIYGDHPAIPNADRKLLAGLLGRNLDTLTAWREVQKVPLLFLLPETQVRGERADPTGQMDIAPTVANLMGFRMPLAFGRDLLNSDEGSVLFRNGSYVDGTAWVDPNREVVRDLMRDEDIPYAEGLRVKTARNQKHLSLSDRVVEGNLIPLLSNTDSH